VNRIAYADPPYLGCSHYYPERQEVDHDKLLKELSWNYDGWALSCSTPSLVILLNHYLVKDRVQNGVVRVARTEQTIRDWVSANITMKKGLVGAKPAQFCYWLFELLGAEANDEFFDLFPGTGVVTRCWESWVAARRCSQGSLGALK